jgi:signal transduction histidine kinase/CheY-like chemotaxis protein
MALLTHDTPLSDRVKLEQIEAVVNASPPNLLSAIFAAIVIGGAAAGFQFAALDLHVPSALFHNGDFWKWLKPILWIFLISAFLARGVVIAKSYQKKATKSPEYTFRTGRLLVLNGAACAVLWGSTSLLFFPEPSLEQETPTIIFIAMVLMGGAGSQAAYRPLVSTFCLVTTGVFLIGLIRFFDVFHLLMAAGYFVYCFVTLTYARHQERLIERQIRLQIEKDQILSQYKMAIEQAEGALLQARAARADAELSSARAEEARAEADMANRSQIRFIAAVSHDVRQPLHALEQYVGSLEADLTDSRFANTLHQIRQSLDSAQSLLNSVLDWSKITTGIVKPSMETVSLSIILAQLDTELRPFAQDKGLKFSVLSAEPHVFIRTDPSFLERILRNLTLNAIRYTRSGRVFIRCAVHGNVLRCQVWDTGIGIPREEISRIYEPFYQVANTARERSKGMGLGLAIVRELCGLLNIRLRMRSVVGKGTVFVLEIPIAEDSVLQVQPIPTKASQVDCVKGSFVILIDDDNLSRDATVATLKSFGCRVVSAPSGMDAIAMLQGQEFEPNIIVADYRLLDGESGLSAIQVVTDNLKALYGDSFEIPAFLISGDIAPDELARVHDSGYTMLHKPVRREALFRQINNMLGVLPVKAEE